MQLSNVSTADGGLYACQVNDVTGSLYLLQFEVRIARKSAAPIIS